MLRAKNGARSAATAAANSRIFAGAYNAAAETINNRPASGAYASNSSADEVIIFALQKLFLASPVTGGNAKLSGLSRRFQV